MSTRRYKNLSMSRQYNYLSRRDMKTGPIAFGTKTFMTTTHIFTLVLVLKRQNDLKLQFFNVLCSVCPRTTKKKDNNNFNDI